MMLTQTSANEDLTLGRRPTPMARWRSPFLALLWKEWRQQRWIFVGFLGLALALALLALSSRMVDWHEFKLFLLVGSVVELLAVPCILGASAFAGERDQHTEPFLYSIPCSRQEVFLSKMAMAVALSIMALAPMLLLYPVFTGDAQALREGRVLGAILGWGTILLVFMISVTATVASSGVSAVAVCMVSPPVGLASIGWLMLCGGLLASTGYGETLGFLVLFLVGAPVLLGGASHLWTHASEASRARRAARLCIVAAIFGVLTSSVVVAAQYMAREFLLLRILVH